MQSTQLETETLLLVSDIERRLKLTRQWWQAIGEIVYLYLQCPDELLGESTDSQLLGLWELIAYEANRQYTEDNGEFVQARSVAAIVAQSVKDYGYSTEDMGWLTPTTIGEGTTVTVPKLSSLVIVEFMNNTWGPAN